MKKKIVAMLLAGGQGSRLGILTSDMAKPAVPFGGKYRIIDFPLSNCVNSSIDTVGVLTQYRPLALNSYLGTGQHWDLDRREGGVFVLPPYMTETDGRWYSGTANAIYQNRAFVDQYDPDYVLVLSGEEYLRREITLGVSDGTNVEVLTGLSEGETVYYLSNDLARFFAMQQRMMGGMAP